VNRVRRCERASERVKRTGEAREEFPDVKAREEEEAAKSGLQEPNRSSDDETTKPTASVTPRRFRAQRDPLNLESDTSGEKRAKGVSRAGEGRNGGDRAWKCVVRCATTEIANDRWTAARCL
jgi:hypothetical protein